MAARGLGEEEDYAEFLARKYGLGNADVIDEEDDLASAGGVTASAQVAPYPEARRPSAVSARPPTARSLANAPSWQCLSRNRAAKRASLDFTTHQHLSTMYHMHRRIAEMYSKSGVVPQQDQEEPARDGDNRAAASRQRPATSYAAVRDPLSTGSGGGRSSRPVTAPSAGGMRRPLEEEPGVAVRVQGPAQAAPPPPNYSKRRVQNTAAALKTAILDEIVANRIYEGQRLKALFRSYLKLNAGESFFPTLQQVIEELGVELGVA